MSCISLEQLVKLAQHRLAAEDASRISVHLQTGCPLCKERHGKVRRLSATMTAQHLVEPPGWLIQQARNLFVWHTSWSMETDLQPVPAFLLVDSFTQAPPVGFRSLGLMSRQIVYRAGDYNVHLSMTYVEQTRKINIMGQPMPLYRERHLPQVTEVDLLKDSTVVDVAQGNKFSAFIFNDVDEGIYDLRIKSEQQELDIIGLNAIVRPH